MAVFRVERTQGYTVMSNYHLRDKSLSLKAKGLLSQMLSLPEDWDYTLSGLAVINRESKDAIRSAVNELEKAGYIKRRQTTDAGGKFSANEYVIYERPVTEEPPAQPLLEKPLSGFPTTDNPSTGKPSTENPTQINIEKLNTQKSITDGSITDSIPFRGTAAKPPEPKRRETMSLTEMESYRELILENIEYDCLKQRFGTYREDLDVACMLTVYEENGQKRNAVLYAESMWEGYYLLREITGLPEQIDEEYLPLLKELEGIFGLTMPVLEQLGE